MKKSNCDKFSIEMHRNARVDKIILSSFLSEKDESPIKNIFEFDQLFLLLVHLELVQNFKQ